MPLFVYNQSASPVTLTGTTVVVPASAAPPANGVPVNVTSELRGKSGGFYAALDTQRLAAPLVYRWSVAAEYATAGLTTIGATLDVHAADHKTGGADPLDVEATTATCVAEARSGCVRYEAPIAAELVTIVATLDPVADGALTIAAQPDYPRKLQVRIVDGDSSISAGTVDLVGVGPSGEAVSESISLTGGTATKISTKAYATLTSATVASLAGAAAGDTISIGVGAALGLPGQKTPLGATFAVHKANVDNANEAVGTVDATAGTIIPTSAPNATRNFTFWYTYAVTVVQSSHDHNLI